MIFSLFDTNFFFKIISDHNSFSDLHIHRPPQLADDGRQVADLQDGPLVRQAAGGHDRGAVAQRVRTDVGRWII